jgi:hypothetical protein
MAAESRITSRVPLFSGLTSEDDVETVAAGARAAGPGSAELPDDGDGFRHPETKF